MENRKSTVGKPGARGITALLVCCSLTAAGYAEAAARVLAWGDNSTGQSPVSPGLDDSVAVAAGASQSFSLLRLTDVWKYNQSGLDLGTAWKETNYNDSAWSHGPGVLGLDNNPAIAPLIRTTLSLSNAASQRILTYYFRTHFVFNGDPGTVYLTASNLVDDGAVVYLNGQEVFRRNMAAAPVLAATLALLPAAEAFATINFPSTYLVRGTNLLAAEIHQVTTNSSDVVFGLSLDAQFRESGPATVVVPPQGQCAAPGAEVQFSVVAAGQGPLSYQWRKGAANLTETARVRGVTTPQLSVASVEVGDLGDYSVALQNAHSATVSEPASLWFPPPSFRWTQSAGGTNTDAPHDTAVDRWGNVYVAGNFDGVFICGDSNVTSRGGTDVCIMKFDPSGLLQWVRTAGGPGSDYGGGVATDYDGNCYVSGHFSGTATFGGASVSSAGGTDIFVAKYTPGGMLLWVRRAGGSGTDECWSVTAEQTGTCYITGDFSGMATFGSQSFSSAGSSDLFLAQYDAYGIFKWAVRGGGTGSDYGAHVAVDRHGAAYVTGWFTGPASFSGRSLTNAGRADVLVAKYSSGGALQWAQRTGGAGNDVGKSIDVDTEGNCYVLTVFDASEANQPPRLRVAKYESGGLLQWEREAWGAFYSDHCSIAADTQGCYLTGGFEGTATFGQATLIGGGNRDVFLASYDSQGALRWVQRAGGGTADLGAGIAADPSCGVYLCGWFTGAASFGTELLSSRGSQDLFVARLSYPFDPSGLRFAPADLNGPSGEFRLRLGGLTGATSVILLASTNLVSWVPILTNTFPVDPLEITIPAPPDRQPHFFRALVSPD